MRKLSRLLILVLLFTLSAATAESSGKTDIYKSEDNGSLWIMESSEPEVIRKMQHLYLESNCEYVINISSSKRTYHYPSEDTLPAVYNRVYVMSDEAIESIAPAISVEIVQATEAKKIWNKDKSKIYVIRLADFKKNESLFSQCGNCFN